MEIHRILLSSGTTATAVLASLAATGDKRSVTIQVAVSIAYEYSNMILFTCSFNSVTLSLGFEGEPFGARKQYAMTIGY